MVALEERFSEYFKLGEKLNCKVEIKEEDGKIHVIYQKNNKEKQ